MDLAEIKSLIEQANRQYYDEGESFLSDSEYDNLLDYVNKHYHVAVSTLTAPPKSSEWRVVDHVSRMSGIPLCARNESEWIHIFERMDWTHGFVSVKYDGLSIELQYDRGSLVAAPLRGDGDRGEDVLSNMRHVTGVPNQVPSCVRAIRGELVVSWNNLNVINEKIEVEGRKAYKSPRNAVAMIRRKGSRWLCPYMTFRPFDLTLYPDCPESRQWPKDYQEKMQKLGSEVDLINSIDILRVDCKSVWNAVMKTFESRSDFQYQIDGIVFRSDGEESAKLKFPSESAITVVNRVKEQCGRTGIISPVIEFHPVTLVSAEVTKATGHNSTLMGDRLEGINRSVHARS